MPGKQIKGGKKGWRGYHKLRKKGLSKSSAARIINAAMKKKRKKRKK